MEKTKKVKAWAVIASNQIVPYPEDEKFLFGPLRVYPTRRAAKKESTMPWTKVVPCEIHYQI